MKILQIRWSQHGGWALPNDVLGDSFDEALVFLFVTRECLEGYPLLDELRALLPGATVVGCSTSGEIAGTEIFDGSAVATVLRFSSTKFTIVMERSGGNGDSEGVGGRLVSRLPREGLRHVFLFAPGLMVNGSALVKGANQVLPVGVSVTGGLAGDGAAFKRTLTISSEGIFEDQFIAVGLYGDEIKVGHGSLGGWDSFGPSRTVTKSRDNVLYELNGKSALSIYKMYLGEHAHALPSSGLLFPLSIKFEPDSPALVRTILAINEDDESITFAGNVPQGAIAQMMQANFNRLIQGASDAAAKALLEDGAEFALLISCVGRKLVLKQRTEEEVETVQEVLGGNVVLAGFYSYGEISPFVKSGTCELHNQTMTITTLREDTK